ncbi:hypothetical protein GF351_04690 [Candidatus Woesearchaeota archaeon]|nr:hypothetical protein [Candidatus Woesearchaeota archaeon]
MKRKIAISVDKGLLDLIDSKVDGKVIRSRSQAIELFLRRGIGESVTKAVILIRGEQQGLLLKQIRGKSLLRHHIGLFADSGIKTAYIVTQHTRHMNDLVMEIQDSPIQVEIVEKDAKGNAEALSALKGRIKEDFAVISGDTYNDFHLRKMMQKHIQLDKLATMGLMSSPHPSEYGIAILDGDLIVDFHEKPKTSASNIVNAGVYIFKPEIFELITRDIRSLERDLFPKLAKLKQLAGFFTYGEYMHME